jgi:hypothetical protein
MAGDFDQVLSKFSWAQHQLTLLNDAVSDYIDLQPYVAVVKDQPRAQAYQVVAHLRHPPPASLSHIVGDVLSSLHGTLDYLAWQLALREGGGAPDLRTEFPIVKTTQKDPTKPRVNIYRSADNGRGTTPLIQDPDVLKRLQNVQPYQMPETVRDVHPLVVLRTLNGHAKHRHPAVLASAIDQGHYIYTIDLPKMIGWQGPPGSFPFAETATHITPNLTPRKDGDQLAWIPHHLAPNGPPPEHSDFATFVALEEVPVYPRTGKPFPVQHALADLAIFIENQVLTPFTELF